MAVPLILSDVPNKTPYIQYVATNGQTVFPYPFPITQDSDLIVVPNGVPLNTDTGYTLSGQGNDTGGNVTFTLGRTAGDIITLYRDIAIQRISQIAQNSGFSSTVFNAEFNNLYLIAQQLKVAVAQCLQIPNTNNPAPVTTLTPAAYAGKYLSFDSNGNPIPAVLTSSGALTAAIINGLLAGSGVITPAEQSAGVTPVNYLYLPLQPERYGTVGDGVADDTAAMNSWVAVINASTNPTSIWQAGKTYLCNGLNAITANNLTLQANGSTIKVKANSWLSTGDGTTHLSLTGTGARLYNLLMNGNQFAFAASPTPIGRLIQFGNDTQMYGCSFTNSPSMGTRTSAVSGRFVGCHFDSNGASGMEGNTVSYLHFEACTWNYNGYGFQQSFATNAFVGFGLAFRFRSHHCTLIGCNALQNGRDGMNVNQGSYAIKHIGCLCWMNGDGGFTVANDNTSAGTPGNSESPYDCEWIDCESYNNWGSGLVSYCPTFNVTVDGGRYYNNNRVAGTLTQQSSAVNGIYFAAGSLGIKIRAKAYDDRQLRVVTATSGSGPFVVTATGWVPGAMGNYPNVSIYTAAMAFAGYGTITAESAGSVTITPSVSNAFVGAPPAGYYVTQRTQHNGVFLDNGCTGSADVDGFGQLPGTQVYMGFKTISGSFSSGQNILLPAAPLDYTELLANPTWDAAITNWTFSTPGGGSPTLFTTAGPLLRSAGGLQLIAGTIAASGQSTLITNGLSYVANGAWVEATVWAYATLPNQCALVLVWGAGALNTTVTHSGGGWRQLRIGAYVPSGTTTFLMQLNVSIGVTAYFDSASLRVRNETFDNRDFSYPTRNLPV